MKDEEIQKYAEALPYSTIPNAGDVGILIEFLLEEGWTPPPHLKLAPASPSPEIRRVDLWTDATCNKRCSICNKYDCGMEMCEGHNKFMFELRRNEIPNDSMRKNPNNRRQ